MIRFIEFTARMNSLRHIGKRFGSQGELLHSHSVLVCKEIASPFRSWFDPSRGLRTGPIDSL